MQRLDKCSKQGTASAGPPRQEKGPVLGTVMGLRGQGWQGTGKGKGVGEVTCEEGRAGLSQEQGFDSKRSGGTECWERHADPNRLTETGRQEKGHYAESKSMPFTWTRRETQSPPPHG